MFGIILYLRIFYLSFSYCQTSNWKVVALVTTLTLAYLPPFIFANDLHEVDVESHSP